MFKYIYILLIIFFLNRIKKKKDKLFEKKGNVEMFFLMMLFCF